MDRIRPPSIQQHPAWGVGLNNFGDYYLQFKRPSSPEDVKDPHNFFVRLAAETGLPATLLIALLLLWMIFRTGRSPRPIPRQLLSPQSAIGNRQSAIPIIAAAIAAVLWIVIHLAISEVPIIFNLDITLIFAILAALVFAIILTLLNSLSTATRTPAMRYLTLAAVIGAVAMFLYDQINMALVTGPIAMLFWMLLGLADSHDPHSADPHIAPGSPGGHNLHAQASQAAFALATNPRNPVHRRHHRPVIGPAPDPPQKPRPRPL